LCLCQALSRLRHGLYLNTSRAPRARLEEALRVVRPRAVVSLASVLGECGAANNPSRDILAILPRAEVGVCLEPVEIRPRERARFFSLRAEALLPDDPDAWSAQSAFAAVSPEKALLDWLDLGHNGRSFLPPPPMDLDLDYLDVPKLLRLSAKLKLDAQLLDWAERARAAHFGQEGPDEISQSAPELIETLRARSVKPTHRRGMRP
jgi:hypothetical protein